MDPLPLTADNITAFVPTNKDIAFVHTVFAQCFFPLRKLRGGKKEHHIKQGRASLVIQAGHLLNPETGDLVQQDVPYGSAARLVMGHIQNHAKRAPTLEEAMHIPMGDSLRHFFSQYGKEWGGKQGKAITQQVNNIAAMHTTIGLWSEDKAKQINVPTLAEEITFWLEKDERQRTFWQPEMILDRRLAQTIRDHGMPYDMRSMMALYNSPREMDMLLWLTYRLPSITPPQAYFCPILRSQRSAQQFWSRKQEQPAKVEKRFPCIHEERSSLLSRCTHHGRGNGVTALSLAPCCFQKLWGTIRGAQSVLCGQVTKQAPPDGILCYTPCF